MEFSFDRMLGVIGVLGIVIGVAVAIAMDPKVKVEMQFAVGCFIFSDIALCLTVGTWAFNAQVSTTSRLFVTGILCALFCVSMAEASRWASRRFERATQSEAKLVPSIVPSSSPALAPQETRPPQTASKPASKRLRVAAGTRQPGQVGAFKFWNNTVDGGSLELPSGKDMEIRMNDFRNTNSAIQNAGKADSVFMEDNVIHPAPGGNATIVQNLPGGEISNVTGRKNLILGGDWWSQFAGSVISKSGNKGEINALVNQMREQCERDWRNYAPEQRQKNLDELYAILREVLNHTADEKVIWDKLHVVPSFARQP